MSSADLVQFPCFFPQVPLTHPVYPLNSELGKVSGLEESHEDSAQDGDGVPGICRHDLFGSERVVLQSDTLDGLERGTGRTYQSDFLHERIPPFKDSKEKLVALLRLRSFIIEFHHS